MADRASAACLACLAVIVIGAADGSVEAQSAEDAASNTALGQCVFVTFFKRRFIDRFFLQIAALATSAHSHGEGAREVSTKLVRSCCHFVAVERLRRTRVCAGICMTAMF